MAPASRPEGHLNLTYLPQLPASQPKSGSSTTSTSPVEPSTNLIKSPFGGPNGLTATNMGSARLGAGSPSHEFGTRLYSKRAREIQAQEGLSPGIWGPPTSGNSTPLRENIPESPSQDGFPDLIPPSDSGMNSPARRARAGTVPSRFSPVGNVNGVNMPSSFATKSSRPTPSTSPFRPSPISGMESGNKPSNPPAANSALLSRLRAGSMPQKSNFLGASNPFGPSLFSTSWGSGRERTTTLTSIRSSEDPSSPAQSAFSKDGLNDTDVRTLDYLGLVETPQQSRATLARPLQEASMQQQQASALPQMLANLEALNKSANRFRSYSVNATEKYADDEDDYANYSGLPSGTLTPSAAATAAQLAATQAQIHQHNLAVQAFANHASASRPRARTAGVLDAPPQRSSLRNYLTQPSRLESSINVSDLGMVDHADYEGLSDAVRLMQLNALPRVGSRSGLEALDESNIEGPTRALWIGSIPVSTTVTSLDAIFKLYGSIESTRVLTHKNCGFVNFQSVESAIQAKSLLNGKEIFPGAGPVRIGYAKVPTSATGTPGHNGVHPSPTPDPTNPGAADTGQGTEGAAGDGSAQANGVHARTSAAALQVPELSELQSEMMQIVHEFGASDEECRKITNNIQDAINFQDFEKEIPPIPEPSQSRLHDAPRLRDIRKRIDNGQCAIQEIEETANGMLPEIAELSSDYLGNTVVQKLFEFCSEQTKEQMLAQIAPHLAEIGVHKNGTWAAQKIIDVAKTANQMNAIVTSLRPYTVALFLDQYGNYVLQGCLRFGPPYSDFIFETMLSQMWEIAQGRFGARAMRACLESHHATKDQQRMLATAIALHSVQLATNTNGALLLTWFLDTCTFPNRRTVLAPRLVPHLVHLCTHKVAYLTVLKVINQRNEPEAREIILRALFFSQGDSILESILSDASSGATLIFKVLTTPFFDEEMRNDVVKNVSRVLQRLKAAPNQGYKRLMDEVGLSSRTPNSGRDSHHSRDSHVPHTDRSRPMSQQSNTSFMHHPAMERQYSGGFVPNIQAQPFESSGSGGLSRTGSADQSSLSSFDQYGLNSLNTFQNQGFAQNNIPQMASPISYQNILAANTRGVSPGGFFPAVAGGYGPYSGSSPSPIDNFRGMPNVASPLSATASSPMLNQTYAFSPQQFSSPLAGQMYQYPQQQSFPQQMHVHAQGGGGRRGRR